jgi:hypothetical protein
MAIAAPLFVDTVVFWINRLLLIFALVIEVVSFVHCLIQRPDAFPAINTLPKAGWLALIGGSMLVTLLSGSVYLLDVRPALRDAAAGGGPW